MQQAHPAALGLLGLGGGKHRHQPLCLGQGIAAETAEADDDAGRKFQPGEVEVNLPDPGLESSVELVESAGVAQKMPGSSSQAQPGD